MKVFNKNGFTLVELLAVIVILAVVMLIAVTAVGPLMSRARKSALATEGIGMVKAAQAAFQAEQLAGKFKPVDNVCFELRWLCNHNYYDKGCDGKDSGDKYSGSVLVYRDASTGKTNYRFWIGNGTYAFGKTTGTSLDDSISNGIDPEKYDVSDENFVKDAKSASITCGQTGSDNGKIYGTKRCLFNANTNKCVGIRS